jgi:hypothetical protein
LPVFQTSTKDASIYQLNNLTRGETVIQGTKDDDIISDVIKETLNRFFRAGDPAKTTALHEEYERDGERNSFIRLYICV